MGVGGSALVGRRVRRWKRMEIVKMLTEYGLSCIMGTFVIAAWIGLTFKWLLRDTGEEGRYIRLLDREFRS